MEINLGQALCKIPWWYYTIAGIFTFYHGSRGYLLQRWTERRQKQESELEYFKVILEKENRKNIPDFYWMSVCDAKYSRYCYDALFHIFCSIIGFLSLWIGIYIFYHFPDIQSISATFGAILIFLIVLGILGAGGKLPHVIDRGNKWY